MTTETLHIKNMVCNRCIKVVTEELTNLGFRIKSIELGKVELAWAVDEKELEIIKNNLEENGFELILDRKAQIVEKIKTEINNYILIDTSYSDKKNNLSNHLSTQVGYEYSYLSSLFSSMEGITIEKYLILYKIDKVKELMVYDELSLSEIAFQLGYNSSQYLSNQFKKITGLTPTHFKKINDKGQKPN